jgi:hypothetical protein
MINAVDDERLPRAAVDRLYHAAREPKEQLWMTGAHVHGDSATIHRIAEIVMPRIRASRVLPPSRPADLRGGALIGVANLLRIGRHITAMDVDRRLATRTSRQAAEELPVAHDQLGAARIVVAFRSALSLTPGGWRANFQMLVGWDAAGHRVDSGRPDLVAPAGAAARLPTLAWIRFVA